MGLSVGVVLIALTALVVCVTLGLLLVTVILLFLASDSSSTVWVRKSDPSPTVQMFKKATTLSHVSHFDGYTSDSSTVPPSSRKVRCTHLPI